MVEVGGDKTWLCSCGADHIEGANYYVSVVDGPRSALLAGPFGSHVKALFAVDEVRRVVEEADPWAWFYSFGTVAMASDYAKPGRLNGRVVGEAKP